MSNYNWCHGPNCHTNKTVDRIRGSKGNKVLRTRKVSTSHYIRPFGLEGGSIWAYFCSQSCLMDFVNKHGQAMLELEPRKEALETPINDPKKETSQYGWNNWTIEKKAVDNA